MLLTLILIPLLAAALIPLGSVKHARLLGVLGTLVPLALGVYMYTQIGDFSRGAIPMWDASYSWFPQLGVSLKLGLDNISAILVALTLILGPVCIICSFTAITERVRTYYFWLLVLQAAMTGVFLARDAVLFYIFFEFTLVPMFVLISLYGSTNRKAAAIKFFLYTFTGSVLALAGIVYVAYVHASSLPASEMGSRWTFDFDTLIKTAQSLPLNEQMWVFGALLCGFAVKVPLFPLHTWLPLAHTEAPTAGSVVLAGVLLKLGTYAILVIAIPFCPQAAIAFAPFIAVLSIIGILYGGLICWVQTDVKKLVAYSSVAHLGFCMLGMFALNQTGVQGSVLYMVNHGLSTGALFLCIGMIYERYHTRSMKEIGGLAARMPVWATFMVFFTMASVGLPGLNGFVSEFLCIKAAFDSADTWSIQGKHLNFTPGNLGPWYAFIAGIGMIVAAMYLLYMLGKVVFGPLKEPGHDDHASHHGHGDSHAHHVKDLSAREIGLLVPMAALCLLLGLKPGLLTDLIAPQAAKFEQTILAARASTGTSTPSAPAHREAKP